MDSLLQYDSGSSDSEDVRNKIVRSDAEKHATVDACSRGSIPLELHGQVVKSSVLRSSSAKERVESIDSGIDYFSLHSLQDESEDKCGFDESKADTNNYYVNQCTHNAVGTYEDMWKQQKRYRSWDDSAEAHFVPEAAGNKQQTSRPLKPPKDKDADIVVVPYKSKRQKLTESKPAIDLNPDSQSHVTAEVVSTKTNFYIVHSKIQPHLFQKEAVTNRKPQKAIKRFNAHEGTVNRVKWCLREYSHLLLSVSMDRTVKIWNAFSSAERPCVQTLAFHWRAVKDADWASSGRQLVSCGFDRTARVSDVEAGIHLLSSLLYCIC